MNNIVDAFNEYELRYILENFNVSGFGEKPYLRERLIYLIIHSPVRKNVFTAMLLVYIKKLPSELQLQIQGTERLSENRNYPIVNFGRLPFFGDRQILFVPNYCDHSNKIQFYLTERDRHSISKSWDSDKKEHKIKIILRLAQVVCRENFTECNNMSVTVNNCKCPFHTLNFAAENEIVPWKNDIPIDITEQILSKNYFNNTVTVIWSRHLYMYFLIGIFMVQKLTWKDLVKEIKKRSPRTSENTKNLIKKSMESDTDVGLIGVESLIVTIIDPLSKTRMELPARGVDCTHIQCFDAIQFLRMNEQKPTWTCPLCKKKIKFENVEVDEYFLNIVQNPNLSAECETIILSENGSWTEKIQTEFSNFSNRNRSQSTVDVLTLSDNSDDEEASISVISNDPVSILSIHSDDEVSIMSFVSNDNENSTIKTLSDDENPQFSHDSDEEFQPIVKRSNLVAFLEDSDEDIQPKLKHSNQTILSDDSDEEFQPKVKRSNPVTFLEDSDEDIQPKVKHSKEVALSDDSDEDIQPKVKHSKEVALSDDSDEDIQPKVKHSKEVALSDDSDEDIQPKVRHSKEVALLDDSDEDIQLNEKGLKLATLSDDSDGDLSILFHNFEPTITFNHNSKMKLMNVTIYFNNDGNENNPSTSASNGDNRQNVIKTKYYRNIAYTSYKMNNCVVNKWEPRDKNDFIKMVPFSKTKHPSWLQNIMQPESGLVPDIIEE